MIPAALSDMLCVPKNKRVAVKRFAIAYKANVSNNAIYWEGFHHPSVLSSIIDLINAYVNIF